ncbi:MAG: HEAT repeat domain-containing protein [Planctomycetes bacterium]|nr:HEAT repeat domain-containing protein [Planctomycetota bacterium]
MRNFNTLLAEVQQDCGWGCIQVPDGKIRELASMCGPAEVAQIIDSLDALDDADLEDDAGDIADEYHSLSEFYSGVLAAVGEPAVAPLLGALGSRNPNTRAYAASTLGRIGTPHAFERFLAMLTSETDNKVRFFLIIALGELRDERAVAVLLPYLKVTEPLNRGRNIRTAAKALGRIGSNDVILPLAEVLDTDARVGTTDTPSESLTPSTSGSRLSGNLATS